MNTVVVILNWNGAEFLRRYLPSVVKNTPMADIVVADNGSTDDSVMLLESEFPSVRVIDLGRNYGFAEGYNRALRLLTEYDIYVLLNSDVETPEGWLTPLVTRFEAKGDVAVVGPKILSLTEPKHFEYAGASGGFVDWFGYPFCRGRILRCVEEDCGQYDDGREVFWVSGAAMAIRADVWRECGGFCGEFFAHMEEIDLCWRVWLLGKRVEVCPESWVYHLGGGTLQTGSAEKIFLNHRNNLAMLYRCASPIQRCVVAVVRPILDFVAAISYLVQGNKAAFCAVWRAYRDFLGWHSRLETERRAIRAKVVAQPPIYKGMIVLRYMFGKRCFKQMM